MRRLPASLAMMGLIIAATAADCSHQAECGDCYLEGYRVRVIADQDEGDRPPAVLYSGFRNGGCQDDVLCTGTPDAFLGDLDRGPLDWKCDAGDGELVVFAGGYSPTAYTGELPASEVPITLSAAKTLPVTAWVLPGVGPTEENPTLWFGEQLAVAQRTMDELGTGITIQYEVKPFPDVPATRVTAFRDLVEQQGCSQQSQMIRVAEGSDGVPPAFERDRLNVYYVSRIYDGRRASTCFQLEPYLIFVADLMHSPAVTAHEMGHALGLLARAPLPNGELDTYPGDVDHLHIDRYLPLENLMRSGVTNVKQVTIGQIYRMHFDDRSWLRSNETAMPDGSDGYPRRCQDSPIVGGRCPPLTLNPPRGWE